MNTSILSAPLLLLGISLSLSAQPDTILKDTIGTGIDEDSIYNLRSYPEGDTYYYPIMVTGIPTTATHQTYTNTVNTTEYGNCFMGQSTNDVYYCFTLSKEMIVTITHNYSNLTNTCLYLLNSTQQLLVANDDYYGEGQCNFPTQAYIHTSLPSGTYFVVSEGKDINGYITTNMTFDEIPTGDTGTNPIVCGSYSDSFSFIDTRNTAGYSDRTGLETNDVYYRFSLSVPMNVTITNEHSAVSDTYLYLFDYSGSVITFNDNYHGVSHCSDTCMAFINRQLPAGTYYVVAEGKVLDGNITTNITGNTSGNYNYSSIPSSYSTAPGTAVGDMGTTFGVSPAGGASISVPIEVPVGVGGMQPQLAIVYNSQSGNGLCGYGAGLTGISSITRGPKDIYHDETTQAMTYLADDALYLDGVRLILSSGTAGQEGAEYNPESDPFTKVITRGTCTATTNNIWFEVLSSDGMVYWYGKNQDSRLSYTVGNSQRIHSWYVCRAQQPTGNYMTWEYQQADYCVYPSMISYGTNTDFTSTLTNIIEFTYESRNDSVPIRFDGKQGGMGRRLKTITGSTNGNTYRSYTLNYNTTGDGTAYRFSRLTSVTEKNGQNESLPFTQLNWSYLPSVSYNSNDVTVSQPNLPNPFASFPMSGQSFLSGDLNGDGLSDIVGIGRAEVPNNQGGSNYYTYVHFYYASYSSTGALQYLSGYNYVLPPTVEMGRIKGSINAMSVIDVDGDGINELILPSFVSNSYNSALGLYALGQNFPVYNEAGATSLHGNSEPLFISGDIDNDGRTDVAFIETSQYNNAYPVYLWKFNTDYIPGSDDVSHALFDMDIEFSLSLGSQPRNALIADMNGNGLNDLLVICDDGYTVYWNQGGGLSSSTFSDSYRYTSQDMTNHDILTFGDFNGDGLLDILTKESFNWYFYLNSGDGNFVKSLCTSSGYNVSNSNSHCDIIDFDGDGRSDVVLTETSHLQMLSAPFEKTHTRWLRSTGTTLIQECHATSLRQADAISGRYITGDFDGDGHVELVNYGYDCVNGNDDDTDPSWRIYKNGGLTAQTGKVTSVTGDFGATTSITYSTLSDTSVYNRGTAEPYPAPRYTLPLSVVKETTESDGAAGNLVTQYSYEGLKAHLKGRVLLGFSKTTANCITTGVQMQSGITQWDTAHYIPKLTYSTITIDNSTATTTKTLSIVDTYNSNHKVYFAYPSQTVSTDMDGHTTTTYNSYNTEKGYITSDSTVYDAAGMYRAVSYRDYTAGKVGGMYRPQTVVQSQRHADDSSPFSRTTTYTYNSTTGTVSGMTENHGTSKPLTTTYTYDVWGNVTSQSVTAGNSTILTTYYSYDATHRFPVRIYTSPWSSVQKYTYDVWGNVLMECDSINSSINNAITHTYDSWGKLVSTSIPGSGEITYTYGWSSDASQRWFVLEQGTARPWVKTWYDNRGREVRTESVGPKDVKQSSTRIFDSNGLVTGRTDVNGNLTLSYIYTYDERGRITIEESPGGHTVGYQYGNDRSITITENGENGLISTTKTFDAWGNLKTLIAPVSGITNTYVSNGGIKTTESGGATWTFGYDDRGNRTSLTDPDAGTTTYVYDALGRETSRTDGRGVVFVTNYDYLSRVTSRSAGYDVTYYTYGTSGTGQMRVTAESNDSWTKSYSYDTYGRITSETMSMNYTEMNWTKTYQYNSAGLLSGRGYPGDRTFSYLYDAYGNCTKISSDIPYFEWTLTGYNGVTTTSTVSLPHNTSYYRTTQLDSYGQLQSRVTRRAGNNLQADTYTFNPQTGNLTSRTVNGVTQSFSYDNVDRLTNVTTGQNNQVSMTYAANGNITSKGDIGQFTYSSTTRPHAVTAVDFTGSIPDRDQWLYYNEWGKIEELSSIDGDDYCYYEVEYGPDQERVFSLLAKNNDAPRYKIHWGDYEEYHVGDTTTVFYWIEAPDGLAGVIRYSSDDFYHPWHSYVATTDHLGSLTALYDDSGNKVHEASYDAWGKRTLGQVSMPLVTRGYTGHEHLDELGLINMNGRLYDFNIGRFLSPDNYVQSPSNPQNYNRYSYCLNNPLKYTDPDGEIFGSLFGFVSDVIDNIGRSFRWERWDWTQTKYGFEIDKGLFMTDPNKPSKERFKEFFSRITNQCLQTIIGDLYASYKNAKGDVKNVTHGYGVTAVDAGLDGGAVTLSYLSVGPEGYTADWRDHLFVHEYGHYLQSQELGFFYLFQVGIPSLQSAIVDTQKNNAPIHGNRWFETDANKRAADYFDQYYGSGCDNYQPESADFFNIESFRNGKETVYINPRTGKNFNKKYPFEPTDHWTDMLVTFPFLGLIPYFLYK